MASTDIVFNIIDLIIGIFITFCGVWWFLSNFFSSFNWIGMVGSLFVVLFGVGLIIYVLWHPGFITKNFSFLENWMGYGSFILYCGVISWSSGNIVCLVFGSITVVMGIVYIIFYFVKAIPKPGPLIGGSPPTLQSISTQMQSSGHSSSSTTTTTSQHKPPSSSVSVSV